MRPERLLPIILVIAGVAAFISVYHKKTKPIQVPPSLAGQPGPRLFFEHDCVTCHTVSTLPGARGTLGPGLDDVGNRAQTLDPQDGGKRYLRDSISQPGKIVREGFVNAMPSFAEKLSEPEMSQLVDWLSTLRGQAKPGV
jgi:mono/diheme cytochrome c family protein